MRKRVEAALDSFDATVKNLLAGNFSYLAPLFAEGSASNGKRCAIITWYEQGLFKAEPAALAEAMTCACFLGRTRVVEYLLLEGIDPSDGRITGFDGFHWAVKNGRTAVVQLFLRHKVSPESPCMYGSTVLGTAIWSSKNDAQGNHVRIVEMLLKAGASCDNILCPTGHAQIDQLLTKYAPQEVPKQISQTSHP